MLTTFYQFTKIFGAFYANTIWRVGKEFLNYCRVLWRKRNENKFANSYYDVHLKNKIAFWGESLSTTEKKCRMEIHGNHMRIFFPDSWANFAKFIASFSRFVCKGFLGCQMISIWYVYCFPAVSHLYWFAKTLKIFFLNSTHTKTKLLKLQFHPLTSIEIM